MKHPWEDVYRIKQQIQFRIFDRFASQFVPKGKNVSFIGGSFHSYTKDSFKNFTHDQGLLKKLKLFNVTIEDLYKVNKWRKDYKNNIESEIQFAHSINKDDYNETGESKYVFEISRLHHLPVLAANFFSTENAEILNVIRNHIHEWVQQNPYLKSIHWKSGIEVAIRGINLTFTHLILSQKLQKDDPILKEISLLNFLQAQFIRNHLSLYSSSNNHLVAELAGLFILCIFYRFPGSERWKEIAFRKLLKEMEEQVYADGFDKEQSTRYHAAKLNSFLTALLIARENKIIIEEKYWEIIEKMTDVLFTLKNTDGFIMETGDNDNSQLLYDYTDEKFDLYGSLILSGAIIFNRFEWLFQYNHFDFRNYILLGKDGFQKYQELIQNPIACKEKSRYFPSAGYCLFNEDGSKLLFDMGPIGFEPLSAHGHADCLGFLLEIKNFPYLVDCGTYQYHEKYKKWRDYFRGTASHNSITIDGKSQAEGKGKMMWNIKPDIIHNAFMDTDKIIFCEGAHNGFVKQGIPVIHARKIEYIKGTLCYYVNDNLEGKGNHEGCFFLHVNPTLNKISLENNYLYLFKNQHQVLIIENKLFKDAELIYGTENNPSVEGWYSPSYDKKIPTWTLKLKFSFTGNFFMQTRIDFSKS